MKLRRSGRASRFGAEVEWGSNASLHPRRWQGGRGIVLMAGEFASAGPSRWLRVRITQDDPRSRFPKSTELHIELGRNRRWTLDLVSEGNQYIEKPR